MSLKKLKTKKQTVPEIKIEEHPKVEKNSKFGFVIKLLSVVVFGTLLYFGVQKYRNILIVGIVNTQPVTRMELNKRMVSRYGKTVLDEIIAEKVLVDVAKKEGITVSDQEVKTEIETAEKSFGGKDALKAAAKSYGLTTDSEFSNFFKYRLLAKKIQEKLFKIEVTEDEIKNFYNENKAMMSGKKLDEVKEEIKQQLSGQKLQEQFNTWFEKAKQESKIQTYL